MMKLMKVLVFAFVITATTSVWAAGYSHRIQFNVERAYLRDSRPIAIMTVTNGSGTRLEMIANEMESELVEGIKKNTKDMATIKMAVCENYY